MFSISALNTVRVARQSLLLSTTAPLKNSTIHRVAMKQLHPHVFRPLRKT